MVAVIEIKNFTKVYDRRPVLQGLSMEVGEGQTAVVIGKSGCGKTTLLRHIARLEDGSTGDVQGSIRLFGSFDVLSMSESELRRRRLRGHLVGLVFQSCALFDFISVRENILWAATETGSLAPDRREGRLAEVCRMVEIDPTPAFLAQRVDHLSGGEKKRVALARALILEPKIILFDEPTANLDPLTAAQITQLIKGLKRKAITSIVATHDMHLAKEVADRVSLISAGVKLFEGTFDQAQRDPAIRGFMEGFRG